MPDLIMSEAHARALDYYASGSMVSNIEISDGELEVNRTLCRAELSKSGFDTVWVRREHGYEAFVKERKS